MKNKYIYISFLSLFISFNMLGQEKKLKKAEEQYGNLAYIDARRTYIKVIENGYESQEVLEKIGDSYYFNAELSSASVWYGRLYEKYKGNIDPEHLFRYSQSLKNAKNYDKSDAIMMEFDNTIGRNSQKRIDLFNKDRNYLELIDLQSGRFDVKNLSNINTEGSDFGPSFYKDEAIVFASSREAGVSKVVHEWNESSFFDLFFTTRFSRESLNVEGINRLSKKINTKLHESSTVFTSDGNTMYFTRNNFTKSKVKTDTSGTTLLKLYKADKNLKTDKWDNVEELPFNSDEYSVAHPALSPDGNKLYFASDMPGSRGMSDLFVVNILGNNTYSTPKNLGDNINTEARETFPFISDSGRLFFASDGHIGLGGLDVFVSKPTIEMSANSFNEPYNVGNPVNTPDDDFSFIIDEKTKIGYFTSNRSGGLGDDDIYSFKQIKDLITKCTQTLSGLITDADTRELLPGAVVTLFNEDMEKVAVTTADENALYKLSVICNKKYVIRAQKDSYETTEVDFVTNNDFEVVHNQPIQLAKRRSPLLNKINVKVGDDLAKILQLNPIYFDLDKSFIRPDAEIELQKIIAVMQEYPKLKIDVRSHTDSRSSFEYNIALSTRRAKSTRSYLINKGNISKERLTGRGYGEIELQNECADGVQCSEEQHQLNRRSEFIILKQ